jgi:Domain of unknown function (DUF1992)
MTERKPPDMSFRSWIDQQIDEAAERGAFADLPGAGKPLPGQGDEDAAQAWLREYVRREGVPPEEFLPVPLKLRRERERLAEAAPRLPSEQSVREAAAELNERITQWRRIPLGPPIFVPLADAEELAGRWRAAQPLGPPATAGARDPEPGGRRRRWRRGRPGPGQDGEVMISSATHRATPAG